MDLSYLVWTPILIPFIIGIYKYKHIKYLKWLFYFVCFGVGNEITSVLLIKIGVRNTMPKTHLYTFISFIFLCLFFHSIFQDFIKRKWFLAAIIFFTTFFLVNLIFVQGIYAYPSWPESISIIVTLILSVTYFYKVMIEAKIGILWKEPLIWINTGILVYYSGKLFYTILFNLILEFSIEFSKITGVYFSSLNALFYILIAIGFYLSKDGHYKEVSKSQNLIPY